MPAARVVTAHTADLDPAARAAARALLEDVFAGELDDHDWEHALGGIHALAHEEDGTLVGHAAVVQRRLLYDGRALRAGYVEGVGVAPGRRRAGIGGALMAAVERVIAAAYDVGALGATDMAIPLYAGRGWRRWQGPLRALTPAGVVATPEAAGAVYVLAVGDAVTLDLGAPLTCDWRDGDVW